MQVLLQKNGRSITLEFTGTAKALLDHLGVNPQSVLIVKDGTLITEDEDVTGAAKLELLSVVSGG